MSRGFVFALAHKWNISCTDIDSLYIFRQVLNLSILSQTEGGFYYIINPLLVWCMNTINYNIVIFVYSAPPNIYTHHAIGCPNNKNVQSYHKYLYFIRIKLYNRSLYVIWNYLSLKHHINTRTHYI